MIPITCTPFYIFWIIVAYVQIIGILILFFSFVYESCQKKETPTEEKEEEA